jgi:hypothetical protein
MRSELESRLLAIYLNDHLAAATGGLELVRRAARSNEGSPLGEFLAELAVEIEEDRDQLRKLMAELGIREDRIKVAAGWSGEKLGRLKLNGRLRGYSPLSRVVEIEGLQIGVNAKLEMWRTVGRVAGAKARRVDLERLAKRAERQRRQLAARHKTAAAEAFAEESG